jgi:ankyrin repeat protein/WD40 repeat protein
MFSQKEQSDSISPAIANIAQADLTEIMGYIEALIDQENIEALTNFVHKEYETLFSLNNLSNVFQILQEIVKTPDWLGGRSLGHIIAEHVLVGEGSEKYLCKLQLNRADSRGIYPIHIAAKVGNESFVSLAYEYTLVNPLMMTDRKKRQPIHYAAKYGQVELISQLIKHGASLQAKDAKNRTPYDIAKKEQKTSVVKIIEACYEKLDLMLQLIRQGNEITVMELLEDSSALLYQTNAKGESLLISACQHSSKNLVADIVKKMTDLEGFVIFLQSLPPDHITVTVVMLILEITISLFDKEIYEECRNFVRNLPAVTEIISHPVEIVIKPLAHSKGCITLAYSTDKNHGLINSVVNESNVTCWDFMCGRSVVIKLGFSVMQQLFIAGDYLITGGSYHQIVTVRKKDCTEKNYDYCEQFKGHSELRTVKRPMAVCGDFLAFATEQDHGYELIIYHLITKAVKQIVFTDRIVALDLTNDIVVVGLLNGSINQIYLKTDEVKIFKMAHENSSIIVVKIVSAAKLIYSLQEGDFYIKSVYKNQKRSMHKQKVIDFKISPAGHIFTLSDDGQVEVWSDKLTACLYKLKRGEAGKVVGIFVHPNGCLVTVENKAEQFFLLTYTLKRTIEMHLDGRSYQFVKNLITGSWQLPPQFSSNRIIGGVLSQISGWQNPTIGLLLQLKSACIDYFYRPFLNISTSFLQYTISKGIAACDFSGRTNAEVINYLQYFNVKKFDQNISGEYLLDLVVQTNNLFLMEHILDGVDIAHSNNQAIISNAILHAIAANNNQCLAYLLDRLINKKACQECKPFLLFAVQHGSLECINILLAKGFHEGIEGALNLAIELKNKPIEGRLLFQKSKLSYLKTLRNTIYTAIFSRHNYKSNLAVIPEETQDVIEYSIHHTRKISIKY